MEQWESMVGMAGMFIVTIGIGMFIQPLYDIPEARAFGEEGTTKSGFICLNYYDWDFHGGNYLVSPQGWITSSRE